MDAATGLGRPSTVLSLLEPSARRPPERPELINFRRGRGPLTKAREGARGTNMRMQAGLPLDPAEEGEFVFPSESWKLSSPSGCRGIGGPKGGMRDSATEKRVERRGCRSPRASLPVTFSSRGHRGPWLIIESSPSYPPSVMLARALEM